MAFEPKPYKRKPFEVVGVLVTEDDMGEIADWCAGDLRKTADGTPFIKVKVDRPLMSRQTRAFVGDWILYASRGYKVYTAKAFESSFEPKK